MNSQNNQGQDKQDKRPTKEEVKQAEKKLADKKANPNVTIKNGKKQ